MFVNYKVTNSNKISLKRERRVYAALDGVN